MLKKINIFLLVFSTIFISSFMPNISYANSAEPPSIIIIVPNAPNNLQISIETEDGFIEARGMNKLIETHYTFYYREIQMASDYIFTINTGDISYEIALGEPVKSYNNIYTLNLGAKTLTPGKSLSRSILLVSTRVILTLLIEGALFWKFGFRNRESWIAFLAINLITQGALNIWINGFSPFTSYIIFSLIFAEIIILAVEIFAFVIFVKELSKNERMGFVFVANILSLILGGYIITALPI